MNTPEMHPDASDIAIVDQDYDVVSWIRDTFGMDTTRHYIGEGFRIAIDYKDGARVHFNVLVTRAELEDLVARRRKGRA